MAFFSLTDPPDVPVSGLPGVPGTDDKISDEAVTKI